MRRGHADQFTAIEDTRYRPDRRRRHRRHGLRDFAQKAWAGGRSDRYRSGLEGLRHRPDDHGADASGVSRSGPARRDRHPRLFQSWRTDVPVQWDAARREHGATHRARPAVRRRYHAPEAASDHVAGSAPIGGRCATWAHRRSDRELRGPRFGDIQRRVGRRLRLRCRCGRHLFQANCEDYVTGNIVTHQRARCRKEKL